MVDLEMSDVHDEPKTTHQVLTFLLDGVTYAMPVEVIREIRGFDGVTPVPGAPAHVLGVMNLRGQLVPVMDLCALFGVAARTAAEAAVVVLVEVGARTVGARVDAVSDVVELETPRSDCLDAMGSTIERRFLEGMSTLGEGVVLGLDVASVFSAAPSLDTTSLKQTTS